MLQDHILCALHNGSNHRALEYFRQLMAKHCACSCYSTHIGSGADILAPRQQYSLGGLPANTTTTTTTTLRNSPQVIPPTPLATLQILQPNSVNYNNFINAANTAAQLLQLQQLRCVVTRSSFFHINDNFNNYNVGCTRN